jgi:tetrathionate reductase subunit B
MNAQPDLSRRAFFTALPSVKASLTTPALAADDAGPHWSMLIDIRRCIGCQLYRIARVGW